MLLMSVRWIFCTIIRRLNQQLLQLKMFLVHDELLNLFHMILLLLLQIFLSQQLHSLHLYKFQWSSGQHHCHISYSNSNQSVCEWGPCCMTLSLHSHILGLKNTALTAVANKQSYNRLIRNFLRNSSSNRRRRSHERVLKMPEFLQSMRIKL
jgi:hypothetical protein